MSVGDKAYGAFNRGAERGMRAAVQLVPTLCAMLLMLSLLKASGASKSIARMLQPLAGLIGVPAELTPMLLLRPLTGSGSLAAMQDIFAAYGPDSRIGRIASVMMGAGDTIFYTMTVYLGAAGIDNLRYVVPASLLAYVAGIVVCCRIV